MAFEKIPIKSYIVIYLSVFVKMPTCLLPYPKLVTIHKLSGKECEQQNHWQIIPISIESLIRRIKEAFSTII